MKEILDLALSTLLYLASSFLLFFIGKLVYQLFHPRIKIKDELVEKDNLAFSIAHVGYFVGLLLAIGAALIGPSHGLQTDLINVWFYGLMSIVLLNLSLIINQKFILRKFSVEDEIIRDQNIGAGVIEAATAIATGLIVLGAVSGEGGGWLIALVFWLIGECLIVLAAFVYQAITPYDDLKAIENDNVAAGVGFAGAIVAIANLIRFALMHDFVSWEDSLTSIAIDVAIGLAFLPVARFLASKVLLSGRSLTAEIINQEKPNVGAGLMEAFAYIGGSVLICWCLA